MSKEPIQEINLPPPLRALTAHELFILTRIPLVLLQGFIEGRFKPNKTDRERISNVAVPFYAWSAFERTQFVQRKKYKAIKPFLSPEDEGSYLCQGGDYGKKLDALVDKYWDKITAAEK